MPLDADAYREATELAELSQDQIFLLTVEELKSDAFYSDKRTEPEKIEDAKGWFERNKAKITAILCGPSFELLHREPKTKLEMVLLICVIGDALSGAELGVSPFTAAALTLSYGLKQIFRD